MATCSKCGSELKPGAKFCTKCGNPVPVAPAETMQKATNAAVCNQCGSELKPGAKFCTKCGNPVSVAPAATMQKATNAAVCNQCGGELKPGAKFCTKCGAPQQPAGQQPQQPGQKGWFTDGVRAVANAVTGGQLNRDIQREQEAAVRQQARQDQGEIRDAQQAQQNAERDAARAEREAERARDRRSMEAVDGVDVVRGRVIWNINPGEVARRIKESELEEIEKLKGIIVQEGCTALIFADGQLVSTLSSGAYLFYKSAAEEQAALQAAIEKAEKELDEKERKALKEKRDAEPTFRELGIVGKIKQGFGWVNRLIFGEKKGERQEKVQKRKSELARILARTTQVPVMSVYLVSDRFISLTFGGQVGEDGGIQFKPYTIPTQVFDVQMAVSLQVKVDDIHAVATNYLADQRSLTTNMLFLQLNGGIENLLRQSLRNVDYQQTGLPVQVVDALKQQIQEYINMQLHGIVCARVLQITDHNEEFERFRSVERELYCTEKELGYLQRTGEFRNRLAIETNKQEIDQATNDEALRYALQQINKDQLLHDDELDAFKLMLEAQKRLREAKSEQEEYEALIDLKKSGLVKDEELEVLKDALTQNMIQRDSITEIMRIQHQQSVDDARLKATWAIEDQKTDHQWEREDLQRRRNWGIEDEKREREWMHDEQEYRRNWEREEQEHRREWDRDEEKFGRDFSRTQQLDEYDWQKKIREEDYEWQDEERRREAAWDQKVREAQMRREDEQLAYDRSRQDKFDDIDILERKENIAMRNMQAMQEAELQKLKEQNRSAENIHGMDMQMQMNRDNMEAQMSAEQIWARNAQHLDATAQAEWAKASGSAKENELLQKQQAEQAALYQQMLQMQQAQGNQNQQMMMQMAQMMQQGMMGMGQANMANQQAMYQQQQQFQQQRYDDQLQRANEYKQDAYRQQDRMDASQSQALNYTTRAHQTDSQSFAQAMGGVPGGFQSMPQQPAQQPQYQQPMQQQQYAQPAPQAAPAGKHCPDCGAIVPEGEAFCGECGGRVG